MKPSDWRRFFRPIEAANRTHSQTYVEDLRAESRQKRCAKMAWLNLSVLPKDLNRKHHRFTTI